MSFVVTTPEMLAAASGDLQRIGTALSAGNAAAAAPTTGVLAPAADSVSARTAAVFAGYARQYQALSAQAAAFHSQFVQALNAAGNSYADTEAANAAAQLAGHVGGSNAGVGHLTNGNLSTANVGLLNSSTANLNSASNVNNAALASTLSRTGTPLIMGGTGNPQPDPGYVAAVNQLYIAPKYPGYNPVGLYTPEQFWPVTGLTSQTFGQSVNQGVPLLNNAIMTQTAGGNHVVVVGYSQSATVATLEMRHLNALPASARPSPDQLSFVLLGDPNNPNGGILERFHGLYIPGLDVLFNGATPPNTPYPTAIYTIQYDGWADFPQYPINLVADANAVAGIYYLHGAYPDLTAAQLAAAVQQPVSAGYTGATSYYLIPTQNLPLLEPLRQVPVVGNPLADLLQPDLRVIVELGYDRAGYANVPTPAGLFPNINLFAVADDLSHGTVQGLHDGLVAAGVRPA
ncbi:PE-PPE domain-containing protein [Mycobacterium xenopi]|uniref:PE family protein n=1 Tax=Mycobacterium xenopi TaxID=1789 RepID=UPI0022EB8953|nr:PE-PPE domain-containing protein [Mycobacterium xenopi]MDA3664465.1 PE-PPE domain-containing protein [Mycobacterium xenopi]